MALSVNFSSPFYFKYAKLNMIPFGLYLTMVEKNLAKIGFFLCATILILKLVQSITYQLLFYILSSRG